MDVKDLLQAGQLAEARQQLVEEIKARPADIAKRTLLIQTLAYCGEWDKALRHLEVLVAQEPAREVGTQGIKNLLLAEKQRQEVLQLQRRPDLIPKSPPWLETYFLAREKLAAGNAAETAGLLQALENEVPTVSGLVDGTPFNRIADADSSLTFFLEAFVYERYTWIPFTALRELVIDPPKSFLDLLWIGARLTTWEGLTMNCVLPVLYPGSASHADDRVRLGRMTDWQSFGEGLYQGFGQHVFQIDESDKGILELREVVFNEPEVTTP